MDIRKKIGIRIYQSRKACELSIKELAEKTGTLSAARISNWENGTRSPGPNEAILLAKALNVAASYLLCLSDDVRGELSLQETVLPQAIPIIPLTETNQDKKSLKKLTKDASPFSDSQPTISLEYRSKEHVGKNIFATVIVDASMNPKFSSGDILIVDPERKPQPGDFVLVHINRTNENIIRKYRESDQQSAKNISYELIALNSDWATIRVSSATEADILATVIEHREYF